MLKLKLQYFGHLMRRADLLEKTHAGRDWGQEEKRRTEDEMAGWHHWLDGLESEWTLGVGDGQGGLACCDSWGRKESDMTERLNWTEQMEVEREEYSTLKYINIWMNSFSLNSTRIWACHTSLISVFSGHVWRSGGVHILGPVYIKHLNASSEKF